MFSHNSRSVKGFSTKTSLYRRIFSATLKRVMPFASASVQRQWRLPTRELEHAHTTKSQPLKQTSLSRQWRLMPEVTSSKMLQLIFGGRTSARAGGGGHAPPFSSQPLHLGRLMVREKLASRRRHVCKLSAWRHWAHCQHVTLFSQLTSSF